MKIINAHTHAVKHRVRGMADGSIESLLKDMELGGISRSLVFSSMLSSKDYSMAELVSMAGKDSRLSIVYTVNIDKPISAQAAEIDGHMRRNEVCAVKIMLGYQSVMPSSEKLQPIYDVCERHGLPAIFHTGDTLWSHAKVRYSHPLNIDELAVDRRKLTIVMAHIGNPWTADAAEIIYKNRNVYGDISGLFLGFNDKRYNELTRRKVNDFISYAGGKKLLFGTDFPLVDSVRYISFVESLSFTKREMDIVYHRNAERLFRLK